MPGGDRTGPMGMGPMTGRAAGYCAGFPVPGYMNAGPGRGFGGGRFGAGRGGWGRRNWFYATGAPGWQRAAWGWPAWGAVPPQTMTQQQELDLLKRQAEDLSATLGDVQRRISELESQAQAQ